MRGAENVYWMFSAAAQTVAAFIAFLLAGFALVQSMMEAAAQADETLVDIHEALKARYHSQLSALAAVTAASIASSLGVVFFNAYDSQWVVALAAVATLLIAASVFGGVAFVVSVIDPKKYRKAAQRLADEVRPSVAWAPVAPSAQFFVKFVRLEQRLRALWELRTGGERLARRQGPASFREMIEALKMAEALPGDLYDRLLNVSRHRNLVFHGQVQQVDPEILRDLDTVMAAVSRLSETVVEPAHSTPN